MSPLQHEITSAFKYTKLGRSASPSSHTVFGTVFFNKKLQSKKWCNVFDTYPFELSFGYAGGGPCPSCISLKTSKTDIPSRRTTSWTAGETWKKRPKMHVLECHNQNKTMDCQTQLWCTWHCIIWICSDWTNELGSASLDLEDSLVELLDNRDLEHKIESKIEKGTGCMAKHSSRIELLAQLYWYSLMECCIRNLWIG